MDASFEGICRGSKPTLLNINPRCEFFKKYLDCVACLTPLADLDTPYAGAQCLSVQLAAFAIRSSEDKWCRCAVDE